MQRLAITVMPTLAGARSARQATTSKMESALSVSQDAWSAKALASARSVTQLFTQWFTRQMGSASVTGSKAGTTQKLAV